jgi:hypothetical protein
VVVREPDNETLQAVARLLHELVDAERRRRQTEALRPQNTADVVALLNAGVITLAEARRYLRLREEDNTRNRRNVTCG